MKYIRLTIDSGEKREDGVICRSTVRRIESTLDAARTNELPTILHALATASGFEFSNSCYGKGYWVNMNAWKNEEGWINI